MICLTYELYRYRLVWGFGVGIGSYSKMILLLNLIKRRIFFVKTYLLKRVIQKTKEKTIRMKDRNTWWSLWWWWLWRTFFVWHGTFRLSLTRLYPIFFHCNWTIYLQKKMISIITYFEQFCFFRWISRWLETKY